MPVPPPIDPARDAIFLDFDGTLVGFVDDPDAVALADDDQAALEALAERAGGALAIVSGRRVADIDRFLSPLKLPAAGVHGLERRHRPDEETERVAEAGLLDPVRERLAPLIEANERLRLEDKGLALVLHYRTAPDLEDVCRKAARDAVDGREDLVLLEGNRIVEIHPEGMDKGIAVAALMKDAPFKGRRPIYAGDDTTDEYALRYVTEQGGVAVKVGEGESVAAYRLPDVEAVHHWLKGNA